MKKLIILFFFNGLFTVSYAQTIDTLIFYTDKACGFNCSMTGGYTKNVVNGVLKDSTFVPCRINNIEVPYEKYIVTVNSLQRKSKMVNETICFKMYDLHGVLIAKFKAASANMDTVGNYTEYHYNGSPKKTGKYFKYTKEQYDKICAGCEIPRSSKDGLWQEYDSHGHISRKHLYEKGKLIE